MPGRLVHGDARVLRRRRGRCSVHEWDPRPRLRRLRAGLLPLQRRMLVRSHVLTSWGLMQPAHCPRWTCRNLRLRTGLALNSNSG